MNHLQQGTASNLGALELGAMAATDSDAALESTAQYAQPAPRTSFPSPIICHHIDDGALEATALDLSPNASRQVVQTFCRYV
jgi:hypothetical protein